MAVSRSPTGARREIDQSRDPDDAAAVHEQVPGHRQADYQQQSDLVGVEADAGEAVTHRQTVRGNAEPEVVQKVRQGHEQPEAEGGQQRLRLFPGPNELSDHPDAGDKLRIRDGQNNRVSVREGPQQRQSAPHDERDREPQDSVRLSEAPLHRRRQDSGTDDSQSQDAADGADEWEPRLSHGAVNTNAQSRYE